MAFSSPAIRTDSVIVDSYKPHSQVTPRVHHSHSEFQNMKNSSDGFTHHIYDRSLPLPPPSTNPSRRAMLKLFIIFFVTFASATLLQALGYLLITHSRLSSPPPVENQLPLPIVVRPSVGLRQPYVAHSTRYHRTIDTSPTSTTFTMAVR